MKFNLTINSIIYLRLKM